MRRLLVPLFVLALFPLAAADCGPEENVPGESLPDDPSPYGCAAMLCGPGTVCEESNGEAACVPMDEAPAPSCDDVTCEDGAHCELVSVQCVTTPCYPQPTCVTDEPAYFACLADDDCWWGEACDTERFCDTAPGCGEGMACPAVCYGRCVDEETGALIVE